MVRKCLLDWVCVGWLLHQICETNKDKVRRRSCGMRIALERSELESNGLGSAGYCVPRFQRMA